MTAIQEAAPTIGNPDTEETLRQRELLFRQLADSIKEVFFVVDSQYRETLYINAAYEEVWGLSCQSLYDDPSSFIDVILPADLELVRRNISRVQAGEDPGDFEFRITRRDGSVRWILNRAVPIFNAQGEVYRISGMARDITQRHRAQEALEESEARFRTIIDASFDGIAVITDGVVREVNSGFLKIFGYDRVEDVIGRGVLEFVAEDSRAKVADRVSAAIDGTYEAVGKRNDGSRVLLDVTARIHDINGRPGRLVALRDVTEKRSLENQFRQSQKMEAVGRLAGGVAHDFNNLLTIITSYTDLLLSDLGAGDPRREDLDQIRQAAAAAASLTRQLLAFSRQQVIQPRMVNLEDIVSNAFRMLQRLIGEDIDLVTTLRPEPTTVKIDPGQLEQVVMNLAVNSRDAMPTGGKLTIATSVLDLDDSNIRSHWPATRGRYATLVISDTGCGMDEQTRARIFEPFFTTKEVGKGTGLGLATVYGIVKQNDGFIWVSSEPGQGSAFTICLPLVDEAAGPREPDGVVPNVPRGSETILLVEDAAAVRGVARHILERYGYTVLEAPSGKPALDLAAKRSGPIDLLLTDVVMPGMSGRVLGEQFAELRPETRILYMSGYTDDAILRHGMLQPGIAYLEKPFTPETLARMVRMVLDARRPGADAMRTGIAT
ncbi:MAG TPA: PAS domain S-box protein [Gemmatimonadales bacterium]|jgi:PAS domain S-box-containing protein|nr:PAS domain S-box protein [Gemmatimonadales bacterium]